MNKFGPRWLLLLFSLSQRHPRFLLRYTLAVRGKDAHLICAPPTRDSNWSNGHADG